MKELIHELNEVYYTVEGFKKRMAFLIQVLKKYGYQEHLEALNPFIQRFCTSSDTNFDETLKLLIKELKGVLDERL
jgi:hypothetical protein